MAETSQEAETLAANLPGIIHIFPGSTISGEKPIGYSVPIGVIEDEDV